MNQRRIVTVCYKINSTLSKRHKAYSPKASKDPHAGAGRHRSAGNAGRANSKPEAERKVCDIRLRAERRVGELLRELARAATASGGDVKSAPRSGEPIQPSPYGAALQTLAPQPCGWPHRRLPHANGAGHSQPCARLTPGTSPTKLSRCHRPAPHPDAAAHSLPRPDGLHNVLLPPVAGSRAWRFVPTTGCAALRV